MTATPGSVGQPVSTPGNCGRELMLTEKVRVCKCILSEESSCALPSGEPITQLNMQTALSLSATLISEEH